MKLDAKTKNILKKDRFHTCAYVYKDGVAVKYEDSHYYKGELFRKERTVIIKGEVPVYFDGKSFGDREEFKGRLVLHNATLLLDGIKEIRIYRNNSSEKMKEMGLTCDTVTITTLSGLQTRENIFPFISADIVIQNNGAIQSVSDWEA